MTNTEDLRRKRKGLLPREDVLSPIWLDGVVLKHHEKEIWGV